MQSSEECLNASGSPAEPARRAARGASAAALIAEGALARPAFNGPLPPHQLIARADVPRFYPAISRRFLEKAACTGEGPTMIKVGKRVAYRIADLEAWIASRARRSTSEAPGDARNALARA